MRWSAELKLCVGLHAVSGFFAYAKVRMQIAFHLFVLVTDCDLNPRENGLPFALVTTMQRRGRAKTIDRRAFVRVVALYAGGLAVDARSVIPQGVLSRSLTIGVVLPEKRDQRLDDVLAGADLGAEESLRSAALFQKRVTVVREKVSESTGPLAATIALVKRGATVVVGIGSDADCRQIAGACVDRHVVFINAASRSDELRRALCSRLVHHVEASESMYASARELAMKEAAAGSFACEVVLWHSSLEKYGASQLNDRFVARERRAMTGNAWAGWMAMKAATESFLRAGSEPEKIAAYMNSDATQFDGHKGAALSFRAWDRQLRQPLYCVSTANGKTVARDVPDLARSDSSSRDLLDGLGDSAAMSSCEGNT